MTTQICNCHQARHADPLSQSVAIWRFGHKGECPEFPIFCATCYDYDIEEVEDCECCKGNGYHRQADKVECKP